MHATKIEAALTEALRLLEDSMKAAACDDGKTMSDSLWSASSELEYALFLMSLTQGEKQQHAPWKHIPSIKQPVNCASVLASAQQSLQRAKASVQARDYAKGYEEAWAARSFQTKAMEWLDKKSKKTAKQ